MKGYEEFVLSDIWKVVFNFHVLCGVAMIIWKFFSPLMEDSVRQTASSTNTTAILTTFSQNQIVYLKGMTLLNIFVIAGAYSV